MTRATITRVSLALAVTFAVALGALGSCRDDDPYPYRKPWYTVNAGEVAP